MARTRLVLESNFRLELREPLTRPPATLSPSDGERDGVRGRSETISENHSNGHGYKIDELARTNLAAISGGQCGTDGRKVLHVAIWNG
jgi:hypothetical protein